MVVSENSSSQFNSSVLCEIERQLPSELAVVQLVADDEALLLSYAQLLSWAEDIAKQIEASDLSRLRQGFLLVALLLDRSALCLAAILGSWKAGGAYVPVPKDAPFARQKFLCSQADMVLMEDDGSSNECRVHACTLFLSNSWRPTCQKVPRQQRQVPSADQMCMVIYTSGSTGQPKGVLCNHKCLWHSACCFAKDIGATCTTRLLWKTPYQWRTAEYEAFAALCFGGVLYIAPEGSQRNLPLLAQLTETYSISALTAVPSVLPSLMRHLGNCPALKHMAAVGEALPAEVCKLFLEKGPQLRNYYGLTETAMTSWLCSHIPHRSVAPVGQAQPEVQVSLLLEPGGKPVPEGEVYFSGILSQGYLNQPELTRERYHKVNSEICFQTGDFGMWRDGELEICGRKDAQVKLHGVRIELAEIESSLSTMCEGAAVVQALQDSQTLVAFVTGAQDNLRQSLSKTLPAYMIPVHFIHLKCLPRLENDKINRSALRDMTLGLQSRAQAEAQLEEDLALGDEKTECFSNDLLRFLDSLGFERLLSSRQARMQRLCDNLSVLAMTNVVLFHWFWCVLIEPRTYHFSGSQSNAVPMAKLQVSSWLLYTYRLATQDWAYGIFAFTTALMSPNNERFTGRDAAIFVLYFYTGCFPMIASHCLGPPWNDIVFHAETVQRWFLLALLIGKMVVVGGLHCGAGPILQLMPLLCIFLLVPSCFLDFYAAGGEYFLPTERWPECQSCLMTPKVALCCLLYVGFSHFGTACAELIHKIKAPEGALIFIAACMVSERARIAQAAIEGDSLVGPVHQLFVRFLGLLLIIIQTLALVSAGKPFASKRWHLRWPARYLLGSYLLNLNFLDVFGISPEVRRHLLEKEIAWMNLGPLACAVCIWASMLLPIAAFLILAAPILQTLLIAWPWQIASFALRAARVWWNLRMW